jgi:hypothetical protein
MDNIYDDVSELRPENYEDCDDFFIPGNDGASKTESIASKTESQPGYPESEFENVESKPGQKPESSTVPTSPKWFENSSDYTEYDEVIQTLEW